jgi:hypothetical protein
MCSSHDVTLEFRIKDFQEHTNNFKFLSVIKKLDVNIVHVCSPRGGQVEVLGILSHIELNSSSPSLSTVL